MSAWRITWDWFHRQVANGVLAVQGVIQKSWVQCLEGSAYPLLVISCLVRWIWWIWWHICRNYWCWKMTQIRIKSMVSRGISERLHCWIVRENYDKWTRDGSVMGFCHYFMSQCWRPSSHDIWRQSGPAFLLLRTILWYQIYIKREK